MLKPITSLSVENTEKCQLDFRMTPKPFLFQTLDKATDVPIRNLAMTKIIFNFYTKQSSFNMRI